MTKRSKTPSYVIELEAQVTSADLHRIKKKQEISRCIYNSCQGHLEKAWRGLQADPVRKSCLTELRRLNAIAKPTLQDRADIFEKHSQSGIGAFSPLART